MRTMFSRKPEEPRSKHQSKAAAGAVVATPPVTIEWETEAVHRARRIAADGEQARRLAAAEVSAIAAELAEARQRFEDAEVGVILETTTEEAREAARQAVTALEARLRETQERSRPHILQAAAKRAAEIVARVEDDAKVAARPAIRAEHQRLAELMAVQLRALAETNEALYRLRLATMTCMDITPGPLMSLLVSDSPAHPNYQTPASYWLREARDQGFNV